jgi:Ca2+-binding EF-hand superfamily protein
VRFGGRHGDDRWRRLLPFTGARLARRKRQGERDDSGILDASAAEYARAMSSDPLRERFARYDTDQNGKIDEAEMRLLLDELGAGFTDAQLRAAFTAIDVNGSGQIDLEEFRAWWQT